MRNSNIAILICTYDKANDLWNPLHQTYMKYWKDCPYNIYLSTNHQNPQLELFEALCIGNESSWSDNVTKCLNKISEEYILLTYDDLFLHKIIDSDKVHKYLSLAVKNKWEYLRLHPSPLPDEATMENIGRIKQNRMYRTSTVFSLFNKEVLLKLLNENETAWEFERQGGIRSNKYMHFYCMTITTIPYLNGVVKGKWVPNVLNYLKDNGIIIDENQRKIMTDIEAMIEKLKRLRLKLFFILVPATFRQKIKHLLNR